MTVRGIAGRRLSRHMGALVILCAVGASACTPIAGGQQVPGTTVTIPVSAPAPGHSPAPTPTPTPTPAPTSAGATPPAYPGTMLQVGVSSAAVTVLQQKLGVTPATGYFGPVTQAAVMKFQQAHGLEIDGQVGPLTWAAIFGGGSASTPTPAPAPAPNPTPAPTSSGPSGPTYPAIIRQAGLGARALALVATYAGKPYLWGAAGPNAFDCSGLTMYVYKQLGVLLQRSADQQYRTTLHVPYAQAQPGDLIFFYDSTGYVYHVGMYAGNGMMWDAPHTGAVVRYENVWYPNSVWVGVPGARLAS